MSALEAPAGERWRTRAMVALCASVFLLVLGTGMVAPMVSLYGKSIGASNVMIGLLFTGFYAVRLAFGLPAGRVSDRYGPARALRVGLFLYLPTSAAYLLSGSAVALLGARMLHGVASAFMLPVAMAYAGTLSPVGQEGRQMGIYNAVVSLANSGGPVLGGLVAAAYGMHWVFLSLLGLDVAALAVVLIWLPDTSRRVAAKPATAAVSTAPPAYGRLVFWAMMLAYGASGLLTILVVSFFPIFGSDQGMSLQLVGIIVGGQNLIATLLQVPFGRLSDRLDPRLLVPVALLFSMLALFVLPLFSGRTAAVACVIGLVATGAALLTAASSAIAVRYAREKGMGRTMSLLGIASSAGMMAGPLVMGVVADRYGTAAPFTFCAAVILVVAVSWTLLSVFDARRAGVAEQAVHGGF